MLLVVVASTDNFFYVRTQYDGLHVLSARSNEMTLVIEVSYMFELRRVRTLLINQRWICLYDTSGDQAVQLFFVSKLPYMLKGMLTPSRYFS